MENGIFIIAHAPIASAMRQGAAHVFPEQMADIAAYDVLADIPLEKSVEGARQAMGKLGDAPVLILTDVLGATPCNIAQRLLQGREGRLLAGMNLPMVLRAVSYQHESLDVLLERAQSGGIQGVLQVATQANAE